MATHCSSSLTRATGLSIYGTDTGRLSEDVWQSFQERTAQLDIVVLDQTFGPHESADDHLSAAQVSEHVARMRDEGLLADGARCFSTHIAHAGNPLHPEIATFAITHSYEVAYDGLMVGGR